MKVTNNDIFEIKWRQKTASLYDPSHIVMADQLIYCMEKMKKVFEKVTEYDEFFDLKEHTSWICFQLGCDIYNPFQCPGKEPSA